MKISEGVPNLEKEQVTSPAVMFGDHMFTAGNHGMAYEEGLAAFPEETDIIDGYLTSKGRFVTREDGLRILRGEEPLNEFESIQKF